MNLEYFKKVEEERYAVEKFILKVFPFNQFAGKKILEVGCGHGTDLSQFAKNGALCHVADITEKHLALTRLNFELRGFQLNWKKCDATALDYPDEFFDCVYSFGVIHHIPDIKAVLLEMKRVLKPGGTLALAVYNKYSAFNIFSKMLSDGLGNGKLLYMGRQRLLSTIERGADGFQIAPYVKLYGQKEFEGLLTKTGFTIQSLGVAGLTKEHFGNTFSPCFWPGWKKYKNRLGWYVYALAKRPINS